MDKRLLIITLLAALLLLAGCAKTVAELTSDDSYVNEKVKVKGEARAPLKIGTISGYALVDKNDDAIIVASERLPIEGERVIAKGTLKQGPLGIGYYIEAEE
ncbi:hypothetical protein JXA12_04080 [Candidatus Woesearchaeota archaeon]|nr:hypothetical protein [Candidatus Woesearchaeota archaeon]